MPKKRLANIPTHPDLNKFTAYIVSQTLNRANHIALHHHESYHELLYFIEGSSRILIRGKEYVARSGDLAIYHPFEPHEEYEQPGRFRVICLRFRADHIKGRVSFPTQDQVEPLFHLPWRDRFHNLFEQLVLENKAIDEWSPVMAGTYLTQFAVLTWRALSYCAREIGASDNGNTLRISHAIDLIHRNFDADLSLGDLAGKAFMSESHFSHVFKDVTGMPPKQYLIQSRIEKAKELLASSDESAAGIALTLGYENPQYFFRIFKKYTGQTPLEYRKQSRKVH